MRNASAEYPANAIRRTRQERRPAGSSSNEDMLMHANGAGGLAAHGLLRRRRNHAGAIPDEHYDAGVDGEQHETRHKGVIEPAISERWQRVFVCSAKSSQLHQQRVAVVDGPERAWMLPCIADDEDLRHQQQDAGPPHDVVAQSMGRGHRAERHVWDKVPDGRSKSATPTVVCSYSRK